VAALAIIGIFYPKNIKSDASKAVNIQQDQLSSLTDTSSPGQIKEAIVSIAENMDYGNYKILFDVIQCESGFDNTAIGLAGEIGMAQFMPSTWDLWNKQRGTNLEIHRIQNQINMMVWAFKNGLERHWTCYRMLYN
jgi:hypothetical protein